MQFHHFLPAPLMTALLALAGCSTSPTEYKVIGMAEDSAACHISHSICVRTPVFRAIDYAKDEMLITYDSQKPAEVADEVLKKYRLRAKRSDNLDSISTTMITAATNGQDPFDLVQTIRQQEKAVDASTSNHYQTSSLQDTGLNAWSLDLTGVNALRQGSKGAGVVIGMIDTPVDIDGTSLHTGIERIELIPAGDDRNKLHGTEVAGILVDKNPAIGIAPEAKLLAISAFSADPRNPDERRSTSSLVAKALQIAIDRDVDVLNLSFAGGPDPVVDKLVQAAVDKGIIVVASAGNNGPGAQPAYPAALPGVVAVTAVDKGENVFSKANRGDYIDLSAPGVGVLTTAPRNSYRIATGTSLSTAHVSGLIALLKAANPAFNPEQLSHTAIDLGEPGHDADYGYGLANGERVLGMR